MSRARLTPLETRHYPGVMRIRARTGRLVRGVEFKAFEGQNFVRGVEKHHREVGL